MAHGIKTAKAYPIGTVGNPGHQSTGMKHSLAKAHSAMRSEGHSMSKDMCKSCGGDCKYSQGGMVKKTKRSEEKGVHQPVNSMHPGISIMGLHARENSVVSDAESKKNLKELKSMPNPKLKGLAHGGLVNLHDQKVASAMSRGEQAIGSSAKPSPKLRGVTSMEYAEGGAIEKEDSSEHEGKENEMLEESCAHELMEAIHSKDPKQMVSALKAIVMGWGE